MLKNCTVPVFDGRRTWFLILMKEPRQSVLEMGKAKPYMGTWGRK